MVRLLAEALDDFKAEHQEVLRAGLATARLDAVNGTAARQTRRYRFPILAGSDRFTVFQTGVAKSPKEFLPVLRAEDTYDAVIAAALDYSHRCSFSGWMMLAADTQTAQRLATLSAWAMHLIWLDISTIAVTPDPCSSEARARCATRFATIVC